MKSYTFYEAHQNFAAILEQACLDGAVRIRRLDGQSFVLTPESYQASPLDVAGVQLSHPLTREDILESLQESRRSYVERSPSDRSDGRLIYTSPDGSTG